MSGPSTLSDSENSLNTAIDAARAGCRDALGKLLQRYREYLLLVAQAEMDSAYSPKGGASDIVQETFLDAQQAFGRFRGNDRDELLRWLREILRNNMVDFARRYQAAGREVGRELPLELAGPGGRTEGSVAEDRPTPVDAMIVEEQRLRLLSAIDSLPPDYRCVIQLRHVERRSWGQTAATMDRSVDAVQKLWARALRQLHERMRGPSR